MKSLNTDQGFNAFAVLIPAMGIVETMPDGNWKNATLVLIVIAIMVTGIATKGSGLNARQGSDLINTTEDLKSVLKSGRDED